MKTTFARTQATKRKAALESDGKTANRAKRECIAKDRDGGEALSTGSSEPEKSSAEHVDPSVEDGLSAAVQSSILSATVPPPAAPTGLISEMAAPQTAVRKQTTTEDISSVAERLKDNADKDDPESDGVRCKSLEPESGGVQGKSLEPESEGVGGKRLQLVIGVNAVTRLLEHGALQVGLLCTSSPGLLCQHLLSLAATRKVPFAAVPNLSEMVARSLGVKRAMCMGIKVSLSFIMAQCIMGINTQL